MTQRSGLAGQAGVEGGDTDLSHEADDLCAAGDGGGRHLEHAIFGEGRGIGLDQPAIAHDVVGGERVADGLAGQQFFESHRTYPYAAATTAGLGAAGAASSWRRVAFIASTLARLAFLT